MPSESYRLLQLAIRSKQVVTAFYDGLPRVFCPHILGYKRGVERVLGYQFDGESAEGLKSVDRSKNWRCMDVHKLSEISLRPGAWHTAGNYPAPQYCVDEVDVEV